MAGAFTSLKDWSVAFENAAWLLLAGHAGGENADSYRVCAEPCPKHRPGCAQVVYGMLLDHVEWAGEDPCLLAERLVATMLPRSLGPSQPAR
jgi:hypothetical protein